MLERRRGELGFGFRERARFARECGAGKVSVKTISRLEKGERGSYPQSTIGTIEALYQWSTGSVESVLAGGEPDTILPTPAPGRGARVPITLTDAAPTSGERLASWIYVRMRERGHDDAMIHIFLEAEGLPREPTTVAAVMRIAEATGASLAEILALLGVEDVNARRAPDQSARPA
jgi:transcriptional regulator with XRE-family HTH domain